MQKRHIFLTGEVQVGKSTLIRRLLAQPDVPAPSGFRTVSVADLPDGQVSVYLLPACGAARYAEENRVGIRCGAFACFPERFDTAGVASLADAEHAPLILMDEVGRMEREADRFTARILQLLDGAVPIIGVVKKRSDTPLCEAIRRHPAVELIEVTAENRDALFTPLNVLLHAILNR